MDYHHDTFRRLSCLSFPQIFQNVSVLKSDITYVVSVWVSETKVD